MDTYLNDDFNTYKTHFYTESEIIKNDFDKMIQETNDKFENAFKELAFMFTNGNLKSNTFADTIGKINLLKNMYTTYSVDVNCYKKFKKVDDLLEEILNSVRQT